MTVSDPALFTWISGTDQAPYAVMHVAQPAARRPGPDDDMSAAASDVSLSQVRLTYKRPGVLGDLLWCDGALALIASERLVSALRSAGLAGWTAASTPVAGLEASYRALRLCDEVGPGRVWRPHSDVVDSYALITTQPAARELLRTGLSGCHSFDVVRVDDTWQPA